MREWEKLLQKHNKSMKDVTEAFQKKIDKLKEKKIVREKRPTEGYVKRKVGKFVTLMDSGYPIKMFVMQELCSKNEATTYVRIGYYIVSLKALARGKLSLMWGQYNPSIRKSDLRKLIEKAEKEKIL